MLCTTLVVFTLVVGAGETPALPEGVLAIVDGKQVRLEDYKEYLWQTMGTVRLQDFIDAMLIEKKAAELGVTVSEAEIRQKVDEEVQRQVESFFKGDVARWRSTLAERGWTEEDYKAQRAALVRIDLLTTACVEKTREVTEEKIRERFERDYGPGGVDYEMRHIVISTRPAGSREATPDAEARARTKAERILRELRDGADFVEMVNLYSDDTYTKKREGVIPKYRPNMYGSEEFDAAVQGLTDPGQLSGIVKSRRGFHIVQLIGRKVTAYESVKEELRKLLTEEPPSQREKFDFTKSLRDAATIVRR